MNLYRLALKNIAGSAFRSWVVALCALLVASLVLGTTLIKRGAQNSLRLAIDRLGADIIVVPEGTVTQVETALLMGVPTEVWMPEDEPTSDLDEQTEREIMDLFAEIHAETGVTILMVTHSTDLIRYGTRSIRMASGRIVEENGRDH